MFPVLPYSRVLQRVTVGRDISQSDIFLNILWPFQYISEKNSVINCNLFPGHVCFNGVQFGAISPWGMKLPCFWGEGCVQWTNIRACVYDLPFMAENLTCFRSCPAHVCFDGVQLGARISLGKEASLLLLLRWEGTNGHTRSSEVRL